MSLRTPPGSGSLSSIVAVLIGLASGAAHAADEGPPAGWTVVGHQGLVQVVIVPVAEARDRAAYQRELASICPPERTCFVNFHTNRQGVPAALPLPDDIAEQATARYRRSTKNGIEVFQWSCRVAPGETDCF